MSNHSTSRRMKEARILFRAECQARGDVCWICKQEIDYEAAPTEYANDSRFELDHYYPVSTHPELAEDVANFRASHAGCNRARGNTGEGLGLGSPSEEWF